MRSVAKRGLRGSAAEMRWTDPYGSKAMQQQISVITLGIADLARSRRFYVEGFGWTPVFENDEIVFYQMNGLMLGTWLRPALEADMKRRRADGARAFALAHNVFGAGAGRTADRTA